MWIKTLGRHGDKKTAKMEQGVGVKGREKEVKRIIKKQGKRGSHLIGSEKKKKSLSSIIIFSFASNLIIQKPPITSSNQFSYSKHTLFSLIFSLNKHSCPQANY